LKVVEADSAPSVQSKHGSLILSVRPGADVEARGAVLSGWHRQLLRAAVPPLIEAWEPKLKVTVHGFFIQQMKTKWGSCNPLARTIRVNTELVKKPKECLEYIVVHELVHLRERTHGPRFVALIDRALPHWRDTRELLNRMPASHQHWDY
jgi:predicted metal-dependent hydrolase